jgi:hypothetical protein
VATAIELPSLETLRTEQAGLRTRLAALQRRLRLQLAIEFLAEAAAIVVGVALALALLDWWFRFEPPTRKAFVIPVAVALFAWLVRGAIGRWRSSRLDDLGLAMTLDRYRPGTGQRIADVLQLPDLLSDPTQAASPAMVRLAVREAAAELAGSDWQSLWNWKRTAARGSLLAIAAIVPLALAIALPDAARLSVARWLNGSRERWPQRTYLTVMGLNPEGLLIAPRDERFTVAVSSTLPLTEPNENGIAVLGRGEPMTLKSRPAKLRVPPSVQVREKVPEGAAREGAMIENQDGLFQYEFPPSADSTSFTLTGGDDWLGPITIERVDRPSLAETRLSVKEPGANYTGFREIEDTRKHLMFLPDTELELTLVGSEPLSDAQMKAHTGTAPPLTRLDAKSFSASFTLKEATTLEVVLTSARTSLSSRPTFLSIGLLKDREPRVTLRAVGVGNHVTPIATIPLTIGATDDYGLGALRLQVDRTFMLDSKIDSEPKAEGDAKSKAEGDAKRKADPKAAPAARDEMQTKRTTVTIPLPQDKDRPTLDHQARHDVILQTDPPRIGTTLRFIGEADDRCVRGVQVGRSNPLQLQVVSPDDLFYEILIRQRSERAKFLTLIDSFERQTPVLAGEPKKDDFLKVMRVESAGARQLDQIAGRINDTLQEMKLNQVGSPKSHKLLEDSVIEPIRALTTGPLNQLGTMLQALSGGNATATANEAAARKLHGEVVATMKNILDQMSQWESFVDVVNQVAEVIKMQQKVLKETEKARETRTKEVFDDTPQ